MALETAELWASRDYQQSLNGHTYRTTWRVTGTNDPVEASGELPSIGELETVGGFIFRLEQKNTKRLAEDACDIELVWNQFTFVSGGDDNVQITYQHSAESQRIYSAVRGAQENIPATADMKDSIGVTDDGVEGIDTLVPRFSVTAVTMVARADFDFSFLQDIYGLLGKVNSDEWSDLEAGECLFTGATFRDLSDEYVEATYSFQVSPNVTGLSQVLSDGSTVNYSKLGFDYVWFRMEKVPVTNGGAVIDQATMAKSVHVAEVYDKAAFSTILDFSIMPS